MMSLSILQLSNLLPHFPGFGQQGDEITLLPSPSGKYLKVPFEWDSKLRSTAADCQVICISVASSIPLIKGKPT